MAKRSYTQQYHDETLRQGKVRRNKDGSETSVLSKTAYDPVTKKWYNVPGFNRDTGKDYPTDDAALEAAIKDVRAGKVTPYNTVDDALNAATEEHKELDMPKDSKKSLFKQLYDKSGDSLQEMGEGLLIPEGEAAKPGESAEDARIRERVRQFRIKEGKDPDAGMDEKDKAALLGTEEYDDFALIGDPMTHHLQGEEPATPEQEEQLAQVVKGSTDFIFGDNMHSVIRNLKGQGELYQAASKTAFQILLKQKMDLEKGGKRADPSVFFAETGAVPIVMDALWSVAKKVGIPGANDPDQYAGALINVMKLAGERVGESGDEEAIREAEELATTMAMTREDGSMIEDTSTAATVEADKLRKKKLSTTIGTALLGGQ